MTQHVWIVERFAFDEFTTDSIWSTRAAADARVAVMGSQYEVVEVKLDVVLAAQ